MSENDNNRWISSGNNKNIAVNNKPPTSGGGSGKVRIRPEGQKAKRPKGQQMLVVFSACGGIFGQPTFPCWLRESWKWVEDCLPGLKGSSTRTGTGGIYRFTAYLYFSSVADCLAVT